MRVHVRVRACMSLRASAGRRGEQTLKGNSFFRIHPFAPFTVRRNSRAVSNPYFTRRNRKGERGRGGGGKERGEKEKKVIRMSGWR